MTSDRHVERDALKVAASHLRTAQRLAVRYGAEQDVRHHIGVALDVIERALRSEDQTQEIPIPSEAR